MLPNFVRQSFLELINFLIAATPIFGVCVLLPRLYPPGKSAIMDPAQNFHGCTHASYANINIYTQGKF